ncbi:LysR family glycine cleavage system transcriptional activator [Bradyrhizobium sp. USDA 4524]|uniref:LysR family transcriptional regulator n=1 Tax=unclassified Bradyrhizobium TaxID=2631580 RepID=UPI00209FADE3|nr:MULTISPECIES: LysR family transcriptional regulator [unclassified Bradyrhizobium]MCP1838416.1 DNA-binding transcriptional LysR family regulator [Bradyrhizobium sp. USDA 4538]MCP1898980.1 DNA-binding transcriptional LysR family regulator [Bradyrhizobium sp. USDA 4537]MCP1986906.1 DNA-binding transcriptional LysR family regulator [Bradyrhizobium sp. USDA 4539]
MRKLPILKSLHLFEAVSEFPSFSRAAERLNMTTGAVSYQMRLLEDWFGRRLFVRHSSGVRLTSDGEQLKRSCASAFTMLEKGCYELRRHAGRSVVIGGSTTFLSHGLLPRIGRFLQLYQDVDLLFETEVDLDALAVGALDVLFLSGRLKWPLPIREVHASNEMIGPVCAPATLEAIKNPKDIRSISLLHEADRLDAWSEWASAGAICLQGSRKVLFNSFSLAMEAAKSGLGAAISSQILVRSNLEKGELVAPFGFVPVNRSIYMFVNGHARNNAAVKQFERWALSEIMSRDDQPSPFEVPTRQIEQAAYSKHPDRPVLASSR